MERLVDGDEGCIGQSGKLLFYDKTKKHNVKLTLARLVRTDTFGVFLIVRIDIIRTKDFSSSSSCSSTFPEFPPGPLQCPSCCCPNISFSSPSTKGIHGLVNKLASRVYEEK